MSKKYLITGGTGFIGSALARRLVEKGESVRVLDNDFRGQKARLADIATRCEFVEGDIRSLDVVRTACRGVQSVFHLAFINGTENFYTQPDLVLDVGVKGMVNIMDGCKEEGIKELFLASSSEVYQTPRAVPTDESAPYFIPDPLNPRYSYAGGKMISELMALHYGRKYFERVVIFRPHNVYGPAMGKEHVIPQFILKMLELIPQSQKGSVIKFPIQGSGEETRAFVFIEDFIDAVMLLKEKGEHLNIYHIGTEEEISMKKVVYEVGRFFKQELVIEPGPLACGGTPRRCPDISKMKTLGYQPRYSFLQGLTITAEWYIENAKQYALK